MDEEKLIEAMARAMCVATGDDPNNNPFWQRYIGSARRQYAAHKAMMSELGEWPCKIVKRESQPFDFSEIE